MKYNKKGLKEEIPPNSPKKDEAKDTETVVYEMVGANGFAMPFIKIEN